MDRRQFLFSAAGLPLGGSLAGCAPRVLVLGDSVAWGQGLNENEKYHRLLARLMFEASGVEPNVLHYASSGAVIEDGAGADPVPVWWPREVPRNDPSLHEQCQMVARDHPDRRFDLILVTGGINDVNVRKIFNPLIPEAQVRRDCETYCRHAMERLLDRINETFVAANPKIRVLVLGYYSVFSDLSAPPNLRKLLKALLKDSIHWPNFKSAGQALIGPADLKARIIGNSTAFKEASAQNLAAAVAAANSRTQFSPFQYVDPGFTDEEAAFAPKSLIFGLQDGQPEDPIREDRIMYCDGLARRNGVNRSICLRASVGHPNVAGARKYAQAIFNAVQPSQQA